MKNFLIAFLYFSLSFLLTAWFIIESPLYISDEQMILSATIAGGKWAIQILAALLIKKEKAFPFIRGIGFVCLVGSVILLPYCLFSVMNLYNETVFFLGSLILAVVSMIPLYFYITKRSGYGIRWWYAWMLSLVSAITLQLTLVFDIFHSH